MAHLFLQTLNIGYQPVTQEIDTLLNLNKQHQPQGWKTWTTRLELCTNLILYLLDFTNLSTQAGQDAPPDLHLSRLHSLQ